MIWDNVFFKVIVSWVAINVLVLLVIGKQLVTPTEANVECPICGSGKVTALLYCEKCKATSKLAKEEKNRHGDK